MQLRVVLEIDVDEQAWRQAYGERTSVDLEVSEYAYRCVAFSDRMVECNADVRQK